MQPKELVDYATREFHPDGVALKTGKWTGTECYYVKKDDEIAFSFYGSEAIWTWGGVVDWFFNLLCLFVPPVFSLFKYKALVHTGFYLKALSVEREIEKIIEREKPKKVYFDGHSAGGGTAILEYRRFRKEYNCECVVFGSARPFFLFFEKNDPNITVYRNANDPVPYTPFPLIYRHGGKIEKRGIANKKFFVGQFIDHVPASYRKMFIEGL